VKIAAICVIALGFMHIGLWITKKNHIPTPEKDYIYYSKRENLITGIILIISGITLLMCWPDVIMNILK